MKLILKDYILDLKHTFTISRESIDVQPSLIVVLEDDGFRGHGEATSNPYYNITVPIMMAELSKVRSIIETTIDETPEVFYAKMYPLLKHNMFALCALDLAYNDLYARKQHKKLYELWGYDISNNPLTDYTIGIDTVEKMVSKMKELPWPIYKIKLGTNEDIKIVTELRKHTDAVFRIDANCGWTVDETLKNAIALKALGVEFLEQPLKADNWDGHKKVYQDSVLPVIADESCQVSADIAKCHNHFHGVNVKLVKCGGLTPARTMLTEARSLGMKTMVGCMTESSVGISAIAHLLPLLDYVDMDGAILLARDIATGITIDNGVTHYSDLNGTGVTLL
ncbi:dipeptide epimerase [Formosa algae]|jgi:L-alanine-DL-glutamate epimerase-like enolase superfamily enzyme|uniref:Dipeptide epimerase n=1 Tax=Formosa algae TaxID=225843 RepID=A0A9X0YHZ4_9FLAO|nr:dipeptide epimerase [Formosa algae]MBP1839265.1 L-alanine-DL-glutamate epimerase-like enolase superfamily enzyme [Formosa algae]MDQ0334042.1 L-alanine-DL-glutamate epimerase-like enolase superfamily enzyme [Formosa algae]OEI79371.1 dipeptide epimerase [Formosa algae]